MHSSRKGQTIIEVMIALGLLTMGLLGLLDLLSQSFFLDRVISDQTKATYLAEEGVELAKSLIDNDTYLTAAAGSDGLPGWGACFDLAQGQSTELELDYTSLPTSPYTSAYSCDNSSIKTFQGAGDFLNFNPSTDLYSYLPGGTPTDFTREIRITAATTSELEVQSIVTWSTGPITNQSLDLEDDFYNWYPQAQT
jgi:Prokaryotic N-terminal methylation motif